MITSLIFSQYFLEWYIPLALFILLVCLQTRPYWDHNYSPGWPIILLHLNPVLPPSITMHPKENLTDPV